MKSEIGKPIERYWFKVEDDLDGLLALPARHLRVYLSILRSTQDKKNPGKVSVSQIMKPTGLSRSRVIESELALEKANRITAIRSTGKTTIYGLPFAWKGAKEKLDQSHPRDQFEAGRPESRSHPGDGSGFDCETGVAQNRSHPGDPLLDNTKKDLETPDTEVHGSTDEAAAVAEFAASSSVEGRQPEQTPAPAGNPEHRAVLPTNGKREPARRQDPLCACCGNTGVVDRDGPIRRCECAAGAKVDEEYLTACRKHPPKPRARPAEQATGAGA